MSNELQSLYQRTVLEHCRSPRNFHSMDKPDRVAEGFNPLCGDKVTVYLREDGTSSPPEHIAEISFEAVGCAICLASASMMTELLSGEAARTARQQAEKGPGRIRARRGKRGWPIWAKSSPWAAYAPTLRESAASPCRGRPLPRRWTAIRTP